VDSTLLQKEYTILIDAGDFTDNRVIDYLQKMKVSHKDVAVATHPDADHIGQLNNVLRNFDVEELWMSGNESKSDTFQNVLQAIEEKGIAYEEPRMGYEYEFGPMGIKILYPKSITGTTNDESISLRMTFGDMNFVLTWNAPQKSELNMIDRGADLKATILLRQSRRREGCNLIRCDDTIVSENVQLVVGSKLT
jgi:beta-lactamase superfamily II metal-dependent hydrolase